MSGSLDLRQYHSADLSICKCASNASFGNVYMTWTRRIFVRETLRSWLGLVVAPAAYSAYRFLAGSKNSELMVPTDIGSADELGRRMSKTVTFGKTKVIVTQDGAGEFRAVSGICTHLGCSVRFEPNGQEGFLACNCHDSRFSVRGERLSGPATQPLEEYRVETRGGRLIVSREG
jgi:cytochrome b6-f complex iron-sulfur subunit